MEPNLYSEISRVEMNHWWFIGRRHILHSLISRFSPSDTKLRICEIGCGTAGNLGALTVLHDVYGVDCSMEALSLARRRIGDRAVYGKFPNEIPFPENSFDVILLPDVLEHIVEDEQTVANVQKLLRPNGLIIATVPAYQWLFSNRDRSHHHFRRYNRGEFRGLFSSPNLKIELFSYINCLLFPPAMLLRLWSKFTSKPGQHAKEDLIIPRKPVNALFSRVFAAEAFLLRWISLPFGLSLIAVVRKVSQK